MIKQLTGILSSGYHGGMLDTELITKLENLLKELELGILNGKDTPERHAVCAVLCMTLGVLEIEDDAILGDYAILLAFTMEKLSQSVAMAKLVQSNTLANTNPDKPLPS